MKIQASSTAMVTLASPRGLAKNAGSSQPSARATCETWANRNSSIDLPIIHDTATGDSMSGMQERDAEESPCAGSARCSSRARPKAIGVLDQDGQGVPDHVAQRVPVETVAQHLLDVAEAGELGASRRRQVPVRERDGQAEDERDDRERDDEQRRGQHEQDALALLAPDERPGRRTARPPTAA